MIAYKVVRKDTRTSWMIRSGQYCLKYEKGKTVEAPRGTLGIFGFLDFQRATEYDRNNPERELIRLEVYGNCRIPRFMADYCLQKTFKNKRLMKLELPEGAICFDKVKVLD